jgi:hypothetical protein
MPWNGERPSEYIVAPVGLMTVVASQVCADIAPTTWSPDPLQLELTDGLDLNGILDRDQHTRASQDLSRLGLVAEP